MNRKRMQRHCLTNSYPRRTSKFGTKPINLGMLAVVEREKVCLTGKKRYPYRGVFIAGCARKSKMDKLVLVVSGDCELLTVISDALKTGGWEVSLQSDYEKALLLARLIPPALVILEESASDLRLIPFLQQWKSMPNLNRIPLLLLSELQCEQLKLHAKTGKKIDSPLFDMESFRPN